MSEIWWKQRVLHLQRCVILKQSSVFYWKKNRNQKKVKGGKHWNSTRSSMHLFIATFQQDKFVLNLIGFWRYRRITFVGVCFDFNWFFSSLFGLCVSDAAICIGVNSFALGFIWCIFLSDFLCYGIFRLGKTKNFFLTCFGEVFNSVVFLCFHRVSHSHKTTPIFYWII